jgi:hypothetical protein
MQAQEALVKRNGNIYFWGRYTECEDALQPLATWASVRKWSRHNVMQRQSSNPHDPGRASNL